MPTREHDLEIENLARFRWPGLHTLPTTLFAPLLGQNIMLAERMKSASLCYIKGNVKENICPSTGSEEQLLDFQPLPAMKDA
jgi:hypothetical protein